MLSELRRTYYLAMADGLKAKEIAVEMGISATYLSAVMGGIEKPAPDFQQRLETAIASLKGE